MVPVARASLWYPYSRHLALFHCRLSEDSCQIRSVTSYKSRCAAKLRRLHRVGILIGSCSGFFRPAHIFRARVHGPATWFVQHRVMECAPMLSGGAPYRHRSLVLGILRPSVFSAPRYSPPLGILRLSVFSASRYSPPLGILRLSVFSASRYSPLLGILRFSVFSASRYSPLALRIRETPTWAVAARRRVLASWAFCLRSASFCAPNTRDPNVGRCST